MAGLYGLAGSDDCAWSGVFVNVRYKVRTRSNKNRTSDGSAGILEGQSCRRRSRSAYFCHFERRQGLGCLPSSMRKAMLVAAIALVLGSTVTASDNARDWPYFEGPQQYLISNLGEVLREQHAFESCSQQQQDALQRFLNMGISYNAAALMAHSQYPCDSTDQ